jgi:hypothetical protein
MSWFPLILAFQDTFYLTSHKPDVMMDVDVFPGIRLYIVMLGVSFNG